MFLSNAKFIFLDIDGVLNSSRNIYANRSGPRRDRDWHKLDMTGVGLMRNLVLETNSHVVLSSTWRLGCRHDNDYLKRFSAFLQFPIVDRTPALRSGFRGDEIQAWLDDNKVTESTYVIIDDDSDFHPYQLNRLVKTDYREGFLFRDYELALSLLS